MEVVEIRLCGIKYRIYMGEGRKVGRQKGQNI